jgi:hypothetical protein
VVRAETRHAVSTATLATAALATAMLVVACARSRPVGSLSVQPTTVNLAYPFAASVAVLLTPSAELGRIEGTPVVFVHVLDGGRKLLRTFDHPPPEAWTPGRVQRYELELYQSAIGEPLPPGVYEVTGGLYDHGTRKRWSLVVPGEEVGRREYRLATLIVPPSSPPSPSFQFAGGWLPVEPGSSKQVVARRCLWGEGSIAVVAPPGPGTVRVAASLRAGQGPGVAAAWRVSASCSTEVAEILGTELEWAGFPVSARTGEPPCEIRFTPPPGATQLLCLEVLAWRPSGP